MQVMETISWRNSLAVDSLNPEVQVDHCSLIVGGITPE